MYNQQQQFAGMAPQAFGPGATPQMMSGNPAGMLQNAGMPHMAANGQSEYSASCTPFPPPSPPPPPLVREFVQRCGNVRLDMLSGL